jgi:hypothetical protein
LVLRAWTRTCLLMNAVSLVSLSSGSWLPPGSHVSMDDVTALFISCPSSPRVHFTLSRNTAPHPAASARQSAAHISQGGIAAHLWCCSRWRCPPPLYLRSPPGLLGWGSAPGGARVPRPAVCAAAVVRVRFLPAREDRPTAAECAAVSVRIGRWQTDLHDGGVIGHEHLVDGHSGHLGDEDAAVCVGDGRVDAHQVHLQHFITQ